MLSIIIPTLNEEKYLPILLDCIKLENIKDYEIIVSDGKSKDSTQKIAKRYGCRLVVNSKKSPACQRNRGADAAKGELLLFLDADTRLPHGFLQASLDEFEKRRLDVAGFYFKLDSERPAYRISSAWWHLNLLLFHNLHPISIGAAILARKKYHKMIKGFDEAVSMGEDHYYSLCIKKAGGRYGLIRSKKILCSVRRFEKEGVFRVNWKWLYLTFYFLICGPPRKKVVEYEFGRD